MNPFTQHPNSIGESYFTHLCCALGFGLQCFIASIAVTLHAFFPFVCEHTGSNIIKKLNQTMQERVNNTKDA